MSPEYIEWALRHPAAAQMTETARELAFSGEPKLVSFVGDKNEFPVGSMVKRSRRQERERKAAL